jgi:SAM-dependent methyltransferase
VKTYWDRFYERPHDDLEEPSSFAKLCVSLMAHDAAVFEIGCGNGRDALFMAQKGLRVFASDLSRIAIDRLRTRSLPADSHAIRLVARPMELLDDRHAGELGVVYMRFVLHAVTKDIASAGLAWAQRNLQANGRLFIEARSVRGSLYGRGQGAGRDAFIDDGHYRRFIRSEELRDELVGIGLRVDQLIEADGLAPLGIDDPVLIRVFATRVAAPRT